MKVKEESEKVGLKLNIQNFPGSPVVENLPANAGEMGSIPGPGRSHILVDNRAFTPQLPEPVHSRAPKPNEPTCCNY